VRVVWQYGGEPLKCYVNALNEMNAMFVSRYVADAPHAHNHVQSTHAYLSE